MPPQDSEAWAGAAAARATAELQPYQRGNGEDSFIGVISTGFADTSARRPWPSS